MRHTDLLRERLQRKWREGWRVSAVGTLVLPDNPTLGEEIPPDTLDELQPRIEEWDPVVELSLISCDYSIDVNLRRQANSDAAQYLRPKLKSIELLEDPASIEAQEQRNALAHRLVGLLNSVARAKQETSADIVVDVTPSATDGRH